MRKYTGQLVAALRFIVVLTVLLCLAYPAVVYVIGQVAFQDQAEGSPVHRHGQIVGSKLIAQPFVSARYFAPRPSAAGTGYIGTGYDGTASAGSNLGPLSKDLFNTVRERAAAYRKANGLPASAKVPVDAVTASFSGLDPQISVANARAQAPRVARVRHLPLATVQRLVRAHTTTRAFGVIGEDAVNVLDLNVALDDLQGR